MKHMVLPLAAFLLAAPNAWSEEAGAPIVVEARSISFSDADTLHAKGDVVLNSGNAKIKMPFATIQLQGEDLLISSDAISIESINQVHNRPSDFRNRPR